MKSGVGAHVARERMRGGVADLGGKFDRGCAIQSIEDLRLQLLQALMRQDQRHVELARLVEDRRDLRVAFDEIVALVDVDEAGEPLMPR